MKTQKNSEVAGRNPTKGLQVKTNVKAGGKVDPIKVPIKDPKIPTT